MRVSFIEFLNAVPLGWGFLHGCCRDEVDLALDVPAQCAEGLASGKADIGLIPVIEYQRIPGLQVLPDIAIATRHEVRSVLFLSKKPIQEVSRVTLDRSSRTSVALVEILLRKFYKRDDVELRSAAPDSRRLPEDFDAALLIGDPALTVAQDGLYVYDLAAEWNRFTGLPFIFAFWAVRRGFELGDKANLFYRSRHEGLSKVEEISRLYGRKLNLPAEEIRTYLLTNLDYSLNEDNLRGLDLFYSYALELGLIPRVAPLCFYPVSPAEARLRK